MDNFSFSIISGNQLSAEDLESVNRAKATEWDLQPMSENHLSKNSFALLKDSNGRILSQCELIPIEGGKLDRKSHPILGIGGIIAHTKGLGYGKILMENVVNHLRASDTIGLGFAGNDVIGFYEKCGFISDHSSLKRFVHQDGRLTITNTTEECVFYLDSKNSLMKKTLSRSGNILLPRDPDW